MKSLSIKHIRYFDALARYKHFGRAAEACAISQPALSIQIRELEAITGEPLVERGTRNLTLTPLGEAFAAKSAQILQDIEDLGQIATAAKNMLSGNFRIGIIPTVAPYLLPRLMQIFSTHFPALEVNPREAVTTKLLDDLHSGKLDVAMIALPNPDTNIATFPILEEDFVLVRHARDAQKRIPDLSNLKEMRLLLLEEGHCFREQALSFCGLNQNGSRDLLEATSLSTLVQMVGAGIGITLIPRMAVAVETRSADVVVTDLTPGPPPTRQIGLVWRSTSPLGHLYKKIATRLRDSLA